MRLILLGRTLFSYMQIENESISLAIPRSNNRSCHLLRSVPGRMRSSGQIGRSRTRSFMLEKGKWKLLEEPDSLNGKNIFWEYTSMHLQEWS